MEITLKHGTRYGFAAAPSSKSYAHRLLICAALGEGETQIDCGAVSDDVAATLGCLEALCADISETAEGVITVSPAKRGEGEKALHCGESGSTLRFLLPICGALGEGAVFKMDGSLPERPLAPLSERLCSMGMSIRRDGNLIYCGGQLHAGDYEIRGDVSSQFVSGLLLALPLLDGDSTLTVTGRLESAPYIGMTEAVLSMAGICFSRQGNKYRISGRQSYNLPPVCAVEGDYSGAAFFMCMGALSEKGVRVTKLPAVTMQGDSEIINILRSFGAVVTQGTDCVTVKGAPLRGRVVDASQIPDLVPVIAILASAAQGETRIINASRLRLKESDRLKSTAAMLTSLGGKVRELPDGLVINGTGGLHGGRVNPCGDHRIAMSAAVAALIADGDITLLDYKCTDKSFPRFWESFEKLEILT